MRDSCSKLDAITGLGAVGSSATGVASSIATIVAFLDGESGVARVLVTITLFSFALLISTVFLGPRVHHQVGDDG
jgi:hypothetical protein